MRLKVFQAASTREAMAQVRAALGPDALILATSRTAAGVEVTAALEADEPPPPPVTPPPTDDPGRAALAWHGVPPALALSAPTETALAACLRFAPLPLAAGERPLLLAGPPGAGKTLTAARLATRLVMQGTPPLVITADGQRAGAAEQLSAFTRLLGVTLLVASQPASLGRALARRVGRAPALIDTPGLDPFDPAAREELAALTTVAGAGIAVVLPAGLDADEAADLARAYRALGAEWLVATRLDHARRLGAVLAAAHAGGLALAEAGIGPGAADGLVPLTPALIAHRLAAPPQPEFPA